MMFAMCTEYYNKTHLQLWLVRHTVAQTHALGLATGVTCLPFRSMPHLRTQHHLSSARTAASGGRGAVRTTASVLNMLAQRPPARMWPIPLYCPVPSAPKLFLHLALAHASSLRSAVRMGSTCAHTPGRVEEG